MKLCIIAKSAGIKNFADATHNESFNSLILGVGSFERLV